MGLQVKDIQVTKKSGEANLKTAQYSISYKQNQNNLEKARENNYEIISALIEDNNLIIEIDSTLFFLPEKKREGFFRNYIQDIRTLNLKYKYYNTPINSNSLLGFVFGPKTIERHRLISYIPHKVWLTEEFRSILPIHGTRFYITPNELNPDDFFDKFEQMMDIDKLEYFPLIIFIPGTISTIGLNSKIYSFNDIIKKLGIE